MWEQLFTAVLEVRGSYPPAPDAKLTPVRRSSRCNFGSRYGGKSFLISSFAAKKICQGNELEHFHSIMHEMVEELKSKDFCLYQ